MAHCTMPCHKKKPRLKAQHCGTILWHKMQCRDTKHNTMAPITLPQHKARHCGTKTASPASQKTAQWHKAMPQQKAQHRGRKRNAAANKTTGMHNVAAKNNQDNNNHKNLHATKATKAKQVDCFFLKKASAKNTTTNNAKMTTNTPLWCQTLHRLIVFFILAGTANDTTDARSRNAAVRCFFCGTKNNGAECWGTLFLAVAQRNTLRHDELGHETKNNGAARCEMSRNAAANHFLPGVKCLAMLRHVVSCHDTSRDTKNDATLRHGGAFCCHGTKSFAAAQRALPRQKELCHSKKSFAMAQGAFLWQKELCHSTKSFAMAQKQGCSTKSIAMACSAMPRHKKHHRSTKFDAAA